MTGVEATAFIEALRELRRAANAIGVVPIALGFNSSTDLHRIEAAAGVTGTPVAPIIGGIIVEGMDMRRAWGRRS